MFTAILAMSEDRIIGVNGHLPWDVPEDMLYFRKNTMGKCVVMGRKTYEGLQHQLQGRRVLVLSRNTHYKPEGATVFHSVRDLRSYVDREVGNEQEVMVAGGAEVYSVMWPLCSTALVTMIYSTFIPWNDGPTITRLPRDCDLSICRWPDVQLLSFDDNKKIAWYRMSNETRGT